jgi:hypothetical protein
VPEPVLLLPLAAFVALALASLIILRRAGRLIANQREIQGFRATVKDMDERIGRSLDGAAQRIDSVRRQQLPAVELGETIAATSNAISRYSDEARALKGPPEAIAIARDIVTDLERAKRAIDMVDHGATILISVRRGGRELEAQTSIKRGYLNLIHAREAIARHAARAEVLEPSRSPSRSWQSLAPEIGDAVDDPSNHTI